MGWISCACDQCLEPASMVCVLSLVAMFELLRHRICTVDLCAVRIYTAVGARECSTGIQSSTSHLQMSASSLLRDRIPPRLHALPHLLNNSPRLLARRSLKVIILLSFTAFSEYHNLETARVFPIDLRAYNTAEVH